MEYNKKFELEVHDTRDINDDHINGQLTVIWRDWDNLIQPHPKMIYITSVNPNEIKGPHLHLKRNSYFTCIDGEVVFVIKNEDGQYVEIKSDSKHPHLIHVPANVPSAHVNISTNPSRILVLADVSWKPNDNEMKNVTFDDYDWEKWKK